MSENASEYRQPAVATDAEVAVLDSLVTMIEESRKGRAAFEAMELQALAGLSALADQQRERLPERRAVRELPLREIAAEVALAVRASDRVMQGMITDAAQTMALFPEAVTALSEGRVSRGHVTALVDAGATIDDVQARAAFEAAALQVAERETVGRFRSIVGAMGEKVNPRSMADRHRLAREDRGIRVRDLRDGMSEVVSVQPSVIAHGIHDRLTQQAKVIKNHARAEASGGASATPTPESPGPGCADGPGVGGSRAGGPVPERAEESGVVGSHAGGPVGAPGDASGAPVARLADERTLDQIRADLFADLLLAGSPAVDPTAHGDGPGELGAIRALVQVTVPVLTAAGVDENAAELNGRTPIDPDTARELVGSVPGWDRVLTHPITGAVLAVDRYTANSDLKRWTRATDTRCRNPGCRMPAHRSDLDHNHDAAKGGATEVGNLCHFCRRHHVLKHQPGWKVRQLPGGRIEWTTPTGRLYIDEPPPRAAYLPDPPQHQHAFFGRDLVDLGRTSVGTARGFLGRHHNGEPEPARAGQPGPGGGPEPGRASEPKPGRVGGPEAGCLGEGVAGCVVEGAAGREGRRRVTFIPEGDSPPF